MHGVMNKKRIISLPLIKAVGILALGGWIAIASPAYASGCAEKAQELAAKQNAELLSAKSEGGKCVIKMRVAGKNGGPPRIVTKKVDE